MYFVDMADQPAQVAEAGSSVHPSEVLALFDSQGASLTAQEFTPPGLEGQVSVSPSG